MFKFLNNLLGKSNKKEEKVGPASDNREQIVENEEQMILEQLEALEKEDAAALSDLQAESVDNPNGTVAVKDGKILVTPEKEGGIPARIQPSRGVKVIINGEEIRSITPIVEEDIVELIVVNQDPIRKVEIEITPDKMKANLVIILKKGIRSTLLDYKPSNRLVLEAKVEDVEPEPMTVEEVLQALAEAGVVYGVDRTTVEEAVCNSNGKPVWIAEGKPTVPGKDAYIEYSFSQQDRQVVPSVEEGEIIAIKHQAEPGQDGMTVTGEIFPAPPVKDCELVVGKGVVLEAGGLKAVAIESGRPMLSKSGLYIDPIYTIKGDVVLDKGPLVFKGHLVVAGSVYEGVKIEALGDLEIKGGVHQAELLVGGKLIIHKSLIDSEVCSGRFKLVYDSLVAKLQKMNEQTKGLLDAAMQLRAKILAGSASGVTEEKIVNVLLSSRFPDLFKLLKQVEQEIEPIEKYLSEQLRGSLERIFTYQKNPPEKIGDLPKFYQDVNNVIKSLGNYFSDAAGDITVAYLQNCQVQSSANIHINGTGCYNSELKCQGWVKVDGQPGIFRGGKVVAGDDVFVQQLGCPSGSPTHVEVPADKKVEAALIHPGAVIKVGDKIYRNDSLSKAFDIYLDSEGSLQVTKLKGE